MTAVSEHPEHWVPGVRGQRDFHVEDAMQAVLGFGLEEHSQSLAARLVGWEDFVTVQFQIHAVWRKENAARGTTGPARGTGGFNTLPFHGAQLARLARCGHKPVPPQDRTERNQLARHGIARWKEHGSADND